MVSSSHSPDNIKVDVDTLLEKLSKAKKDN